MHSLESICVRNNIAQIHADLGSRNPTARAAEQMIRQPDAQELCERNFVVVRNYISEPNTRKER